MVSPKKISEFKPILTNVAQTSHYQVFFDGLSPDLFTFLGQKNVDRRFITENSGLLCSAASIPGSALATSDIFGNFTGVQEKFAHTRIFSEMIKFFEHWMDYISSGSEKRRITSFSKASPGYFYRMRYPKGNSGYKCDKTKIVKFNVDYKKEIEYTFIGMFPINLASTPVQYGNSDVLKVNCTFNYERYIAGESTNLSVLKGSSENNS